MALTSCVSDSDPSAIASTSAFSLDQAPVASENSSGLSLAVSDENCVQLLTSIGTVEFEGCASQWSAGDGVIAFLHSEFVVLYSTIGAKVTDGEWYGVVAQDGDFALLTVDGPYQGVGVVNFTSPDGTTTSCRIDVVFALRC